MSASMDDYIVDMTDVLGRGSYGQVYRGRKRTSGSPIAVKRSNFKNGGIPRTTVREICLLKLLSDDPHFVRLLHAEKDKDADVMNIVMEYVDGNLEKEIDDKKRLITIPEMKDLMYQLCKGLAVSHSRGIMHRDLKPANLLLNKNRRLKIADLGSSRKINFPTKDYTPSVGTIWYKAPEILLKASTYTMAVDMWSAGCIFAELAEEEIFFETLTPDIKDQVRKIFRRLGPPDENTWPVISSQPEADMREYDDPYEKISFKSLFPRLDKDGRNLLKVFPPPHDGGNTSTSHINQDQHPSLPGTTTTKTADGAVSQFKLVDNVVHQEEEDDAFFEEAINENIPPHQVQTIADSHIDKFEEALHSDLRISNNYSCRFQRKGKTPEELAGLNGSGLDKPVNWQEMLRIDPAQRITAKDAISHPYFDQVDKNNL